MLAGAQDFHSTICKQFYTYTERDENGRRTGNKLEGCKKCWDSGKYDKDEITPESEYETNRGG